MKRLLISAFALAVVGLAGCGNGDSQKSTPPAASAAASAATSAAPTPEPSATESLPDLSKGLIVSVCNAQGAPTNQIVSFDPTKPVNSDNILGGVHFANDLTFQQDTSNGGCNDNATGRHALTAFNYDGQDGAQPFSKFFASKVQSDGSSQIGYYGAVPAGSEADGSAFTPLTQTTPRGDQDEILRDLYPSYHGGRVYFVRVDGDNAMSLWSVPASGGDAKAEPSVPGVDFKHGYGLEDNFYVPEAAQVVANSYKYDAAFSADGKLAAMVQFDNVHIGPVDKLDSLLNEPSTQINTAKFSQYDVVPVGFVPGAGKSLIITDQVRIYRVDGSKITTLYKNLSKQRISDVTMSPNGALAFMMKTDATTVKAFVLPKGAETAQAVGQFNAAGNVSILRLN